MTLISPSPLILVLRHNLIMRHIVIPHAPPLRSMPPHGHTASWSFLAVKHRLHDRLSCKHLTVRITIDVQTPKADGPTAPIDADIISKRRELDAVIIDLGPRASVAAFAGIVGWGVGG